MAKVLCVSSVPNKQVDSRPCKASLHIGRRRVRMDYEYRTGEPDYDVLTPSAATFREAFVRCRDTCHALVLYRIKTEIWRATRSSH